MAFLESLKSIVITIAYTTVETRSVITLLFQHYYFSGVGIAVGGLEGIRGWERSWSWGLPGNSEITPYDVNLLYLDLLASWFSLSDIYDVTRKTPEAHLNATKRQFGESKQINIKNMVTLGGKTRLCFHETVLGGNEGRKTQETHNML